MVPQKSVGCEVWDPWILHAKWPGLTGQDIVNDSLGASNPGRCWKDLILKSLKSGPRKLQAHRLWRSL